MVILIDVIVLAIIGLFVFIGYKQGLIKSLIKILSFAIAIIVAFILFKQVSNIIISKTSIDDKIKNVIIKKLTPEGMRKEDITITEDSIAKSVIPQGIVNVANNSIEQIADTITIKIIQICTFIIIFILVKLILLIVSVLANLIAKLPVVKQFDKVRWYYMWICKRSINNIYIVSSSVYSKTIN